MVVEGKSSSWENVKSGIPQGTVLGPILFLIFVNDLTDDLTSMTKLFADDTKVYREVNNREDASSLQKDVETLTTWSRVWQLPFNATKCKCMHFGKKNQQHKYKMNEHTLEEVEVEKDLGVIVDKNLKFHKHASFAVKKANTILGLIKRSFTVFDHKTLPKLFKAMVRPHLEYGNVVWRPHLKLHQQAIETIQKRATKLIRNIKDLPYSERLKDLNLPSLSYRRRRGDMLQTYKIISGKVNIDKNIFFQFSTTATRGHRYKIYKQRATKLPKIQSFSNGIVSEWNNLSAEVVDSKTTNEFKTRLNDLWIGRKFESYSKPRGRNYRCRSKVNNLTSIKTVGELQSSSTAQRVLVSDIQRLPEKRKKYMTQLWCDLIKNGLNDPLSLSLSKKTGRAVIFDGNHRLTILRNKNVKWVPLKVSYFFIEDDYNESFPLVPRMRKTNGVPSQLRKKLALS